MPVAWSDARFRGGSRAGRSAGDHCRSALHRRDVVALLLQHLLPAACLRAYVHREPKEAANLRAPNLQALDRLLYAKTCYYTDVDLLDLICPVLAVRLTAAGARPASPQRGLLRQPHLAADKKGSGG
jgi:hypothetical protein